MEEIREQANKWIRGKYCIPDALPQADKIIQGLIEAWDNEKFLSDGLFKRAQRAESRIKELEIQVFDRGESYALAQSEIATLQSLVPHLDDGSCEACGCVPATQAILCEECREKVNSYRVDCCNDDCGWSGMSADCSCQPHSPNELLCPECREVVEPVTE